MNFINYDVFMYIKIVFMPPPFSSPLSVLPVCPVCPVMYKNSFRETISLVQWPGPSWANK